MAISMQELTAVVSARITDFSEKMREASNHAGHFATEFAHAGAHVAEAATEITAAVVEIGVVAYEVGEKVIEAAEEEHKAIARLGAVFRAAGKDAAATVEEVEHFAKARAEVTNFGVVATTQGAAVLATFRTLREEAFFRTLKAAQDLAELMGGDLQGAVLQLGKALEDPEHGLMMLRRAGIVFTASQQDLIKGLVESGRLMEAQEVILSTVEGKLGGVAEAARSPLDQFHNMLHGFMAEIGEQLLPTFDAFVKDLRKLATENKEHLVEVARSISEFGMAIVKLVAQHPRLASFLALFAIGKFVGLNAAIVELGRGILGMGGAVGKMVAAAAEGGSAISKIGMAATAAKAGLVALAVAGIAALAVAIYRAMPSIREWNKQLEDAAKLNAKVADEFEKRKAAMLEQANSMTGQQREDFLNEQLKMAQRNLAGLEASLNGAKKQYDEYNTGWHGFTGNKVLEDLKNQVDDSEAALERQKGLVESIKNEMRGGAGPAAGGAAAGPVGPPGADTLSGQKAAAKEAKAEKKTAEEHADDVKKGAEALRDFGDAMHELRDRLPQKDVEAFSQSAAKLLEELNAGSIDSDEFKYRLSRLREEMQSLAETEQKMLSFGEGLNALRDQLSPEVLGGAVEAAGSLRDQLEQGSITMDEFDAGLKSINERLQAATESAKLQTEIDQSNLSDEQAKAFSGSLANLQAQMDAGNITVEQFNGRLEMMREDLTVATQATEAIDRFTEAQAKIPAAAGVVEQFGKQVDLLQERFLRGEISMEEFRASIGKLDEQATKAAEKARLEALARGDLKGAGLDFNQAVQEKLLQTQSGLVEEQFNAAVQQMVNAMLGITESAQGVEGSFTQIGEQINNFGEIIGSVGSEVHGGSEKAGEAMQGLAEFLNSKEGMIASIQNQIASLQQFLSLSSLDYQKRAAILAQIDALAAQLQALLREPPPPLSPWHGDPNFVDPGLDDGKSRNGRERHYTPPTINIHSIFPPSPADKRALMDAIIDELQRTGFSI